MAAASIAMSGWTLEAKAADLGGGCCADLEERVADLEATTVRKGNRKVSVELSGQVNKALVAWDDGVHSDAFVEDNAQSSSRLRVKGTAAISPEFKAGFYTEFEFRDGDSRSVSAFDSVGRSWEGSGFRTRQNNVFFESKTAGRVTLGLQNASTKDVTFINLASNDIGSDPDNNFLNSFKVTDNGLTGTKTTRQNTVNFWNALDSNRLEGVRYDTPSVYGFILSAFWGGNDFWDIALRYQKEWNSFRVAAGIGYAYAGHEYNGGTTLNAVETATFGLSADQYNNTGYGNAHSKAEVISGSASVIHVPTGLYFAFAAAERQLTNPAYGNDVVNKDANYWYVQGGINKRFFEYGASTLYGEYGNYDDFAVGSYYTTTVTGTSVANSQRITSSNTERYGLGFIQSFDAAALDVYVTYQHVDLSATVKDGATTKTVNPGSTDAVVTGMKLKF